MRSTIATATVLVFTVLSPTLTYAAPMGDMPNYHHPVASGGGVGNGAGSSFLEGRSLAGLGYSETLSRREHGGSSPYSTSGWTMKWVLLILCDNVSDDLL